MMRAQILAIAFVALVSALSDARQGAPQNARSGASLTGRVTMTANGEQTPIRRARVTAEPAGQTPVEVTDTDTDGAFRFDNLRPGSYRITADKPGFVMADAAVQRSTNPAAPFDVRSGQSATGNVSMVRGAVLAGRVLSGAGRPAPNVLVSAIRFSYGAFGRQQAVVRQVRTDDLGRYRVHTLPAGDYWIAMAPDRNQGFNDGWPAGQRPPGLAQTYYPGTVHADDARSVTVAAGESVEHLDFTAVLVPMASVTVRVVDSNGNALTSSTARLQRVGAPPGEVSGLVLEPGKFLFPTVPPADYWVSVAAVPAPGKPAEYGTVRVTVAGQDLPDLAMTVAPGATLTGRVVLEGETALPPGLQLRAYETEFELPQPASAPANPGAGLVGADGSFSLSGLLGPRVIRVDRLPDGWALKGVWLGDKDVTDAPIDFSSSDTPRTFRVVVTHATADITGSVTDSRDRPAACRVVVFGDGGQFWRARSRFIKSAPVGVDGKFSVAGLLPGQYLVAAVGYLDEGAWTDPGMLTRLRAIATPVAVNGAGRVPISLRVKSLQ